ncbi:hypothetical protein [Dyadobacter aurulentus]|uniref:hypothetical protein n=1 Tax=Dyadobacter sp. UC 10 TaxID=2605428 RepID=UPI0011F0AFC2|nr:hypothetical protein [Dyadobacter sp. UC 10]KAA0992755.1 hypothetical protein FXO21_22550 [Dyadobacter sp. UC 10]
MKNLLYFLGCLAEYYMYVVYGIAGLIALVIAVIIAIFIFSFQVLVWFFDSSQPAPRFSFRQ